MIAAMLGYVAFGTVTGVALHELILDDDDDDDRPIGPPGSAPAIAFLAGLLWPLTWIATLLYAAWRFVRMIGSSFAVLWRSRRWGSGLPKAMAAKRRCDHVGDVRVEVGRDDVSCGRCGSRLR